MLSTEDKEQLYFGMLFINEGFYGSFIDYLNEALSVKRVNYGINYPELDDKQIHKPQGDFYVTMFNLKNKDYIVYINGQNEAMFSQVTKFNSFDDMNVVYDLTNDRNSFSVFGSVIYVLLQMMEKTNIDGVWFDGLSSKYVKIYKAISQNENIKNKLRKYGYNIEMKTYKNKSLFFISKI